MAQPVIKRTAQATPLPNFLAPADGNAETDGGTAETTAAPVAEPVAEQGTAAEILPEPEPVLSDVDDHAQTVLDQIQRLDMERLEVAAQLVNTFNRAIQVQAGRNDWNAQDYAAFIVALRSIDNIGYETKRSLKKA